MRLYTVHQNPDPLSGNDLVFVKEGFCWPAFFFPMLWPLWHRLWLVALMVLVITGVVDAVTMELDWTAGTLKGGAVTQITHSTAQDVLPVFSPDGKSLMWTSTRSPDGTSQLWIADWLREQKPVNTNP